MCCGLGALLGAARLGASDGLGRWELGSAPLWDLMRRPLRSRARPQGLCPRTPARGQPPPWTPVGARRQVLLTPGPRSGPAVRYCSPLDPGRGSPLGTGQGAGKGNCFTKNPPWRPNGGKVALRGRLRPVDFQTPLDTKKAGHRPSWASERKRGLFWQHVSSGLVLSGEEFPNSTLQSVQEPAPESPRPPPLAGG